MVPIELTILNVARKLTVYIKSTLTPSYMNVHLLVLNHVSMHSLLHVERPKRYCSKCNIIMKQIEAFRIQSPV